MKLDTVLYLYETLPISEERQQHQEIFERIYEDKHSLTARSFYSYSKCVARNLP